MIRWIFVVALFLLARPAWAQDERPTGYPRSANEGSTRPVSLSGVYTADVRSDIGGGIARGTRYLDNLDLQIAVDADRLVGWHGARLFAYAIYNNGRNFSSDLVGDAQGVSNIETGVRALRLFEAWVEQDVGRNASLKAGLYNLNSEFDTTQSGGFFLISSHGIGPDFSQSGRNGPSIFPVTSLAVRAEGKLGTHWLARVAVLDGVPGDPAHPATTAIKLSARDGALVVGEVNYLSGGMKAAIGAWGYTARFDAIPLGDASSSGRGNAGAYVFAEYRLKGTRADDADGLAGWLRFGIADTRYNPIARYLGGGLVYSGTFKGRKDDQIGLSFAAASFGNRYRRSQALAGKSIGGREIVIEAGYLAVLAPWLRVQPDVQYVIRPGGDTSLGNAVVVGFRLKVGQ
ncbi:carbohydrate porin [Sphingomonas sp. GB1N7]|uniref:carbohydrate porin n=1 Tax=Parasphingomonas caseinilytica TaxID=3096158 RepID=UPI002FC800C0